MKVQNSLDIDLNSFSFYHREKVANKTVKFRCHRDFVYYALSYYYPDTYNVSRVTAHDLEKRGAFGLSLPWWLMWTMLQLTNTISFLRNEELALYLNGKHMHNWFSLVLNILTPYKMTYQRMLSEVESSIENGEVVGIDISISMGGLIDHVLFVYGYDKDSLYVFDTHQIPALEYEKITDDERYIMRLPKEVVKRRCGAFARVWKVVKE